MLTLKLVLKIASQFSLKAFWRWCCLRNVIPFRSGNPLQSSLGIKTKWQDSNSGIVPLTKVQLLKQLLNDLKYLKIYILYEEEIVCLKDVK